MPSLPESDEQSEDTNTMSFGSGVKKDDESTENAPREKNGKKKKSGKKGGAPHTPSKLGRKGDPRMHRAVAARLEDPNMSLLDALRAGGFEFPDLENGGGDDKVLDADSVQLCQRKNQLSRRLRLARQQAAQAAENGSSGKGGKGQKNGGGAQNNDTNTQGSEDKSQDSSGNKLSSEAQARMQILMRHSHLSEEQARRFIGNSAGENISGQSGDNSAADVVASNKQKAIQDAAQALLEEETTHRDEVEPFLKRKASALGVSGEGSIDYCADQQMNVDEEDVDLALGRHNRIAKNHPLFGAQQQALMVAQQQQIQQIQAAAGSGQGGQGGENRRVWGGRKSQSGTSVMNASPAEAAAALPAAVASLQRLTGGGSGLFAGLGLPTGGLGLGGSDASGFGSQQQPAPGTLLGLTGAPAPLRSMIGAGAGATGAQFLQSQLSGLNNKSDEGKSTPEPKKTSDEASVNSAASSNLAKQAQSLGLSREQLKSVLVSGGFDKNILDDDEDDDLQKEKQNQQEHKKQKKAEAEPSLLNTGIISSHTSNNGAEYATGIVTNRQAGRGKITSLLPPFPTGDVKVPDENANNDVESKMKMALNFHRAETASLLKRCMIMAGFDPTETEECDSIYLEFARRATAGEARRIERLRSSLVVNDRGGPGPASSSPDFSSSKGIYSHTNASSISPSQPASMDKNGSKNDNDSKSTLETEQASTSANQCGGAICTYADEPGKQEKDKCFGGRHVHQLEGKCGHQAIIHQPEDGQAHIDFIVNGRVECYEGIKPLGNTSAMWPSSYHCNELDCKIDGVGANHEVTCGENRCQQQCHDAAQKIDPKILSLSDIDFNGNEWKMEVYTGDESLLGLMGLAYPGESV